MSAETLTNAKRLLGLRKALGYVEDGSEQSITMFQDDATKDFFIEVESGSNKTTYHDSSFLGVLSKLAEAQKLN